MIFLNIIHLYLPLYEADLSAFYDSIFHIYTAQEEALVDSAHLQLEILNELAIKQQRLNLK